VIFRPHNSGESWGRFRDISVAGAKLVTRCPLTAGETIIFDATLSGGNVITSVPAEVVWTMRDGVYVVCGLAISDEAASGVIFKSLKAILAAQKEAHIVRIEKLRAQPAFSIA
jgi:hypothetical protein